MLQTLQTSANAEFLIIVEWRERLGTARGRCAILRHRNGYRGIKNTLRVGAHRKQCREKQYTRVTQHSCCILNIYVARFLQILVEGGLVTQAHILQKESDDGA